MSALFPRTLVLGAFAALGTSAGAGPLILPGPPDQVIEILCTSTEGCGKSSGSAPDGTLFTAAPNPSQPSTGTGVFQPFVRIQRPSASANNPGSNCNGSGDCVNVNGTMVPSENGFNSDAPQSNAQGDGINFDTKPGTWTRSVLMSEFEILPGGYILLSLDANQLGKPGQDINKIAITQMEIFIGPGLSHPETSPLGIEGTGYGGTLFDADSNQTDDRLLGLSWRWSLDSAVNRNVDVVLQASICDTRGQCGSGHGDLNVFVPVSLLGTFSPTDNFVFYSEYLYANDGFEEWKFQDAPPGQTPEPGTLALVGLSLAGLAFARRRRAAGVRK